MTKPNDGGPAFPVNDGIDGESRGGAPLSEGMSLRDYFAAHAPEEALVHTATVAACCKLLGIDAKEYDPNTHWPIANAKARYIYADAMLKARAIEADGRVPA